MTNNFIIIDSLYISINTLKNIYTIEEKKFSDYKRIGIKIDGFRHNLSHIMYSKVKKIKRSGTKPQIIKVDDSSYEHHRHIIIDSIINNILIKSQKGLSSSSLSTTITESIYYLDWLKETSKTFPTDIKNARDNYIDYTYFLKDCVRKGKYKNPVAQRKQKAALELLVIYFDDKEKDISTYIKPIPTNNHFYGHTTVDPKDIEYAFNFYYKFFDQVADFLLEKKPYPYKISLPYGPALLWAAETSVIPEGVDSYKRMNCVDYENARILDEKELLYKTYNRPDWDTLSSDSKAKIKYQELTRRKEQIKKIELLNQDTRHPYRLVLGSKALKAYYIVLLTLTGMNDSLLATLRWDNDDFAEGKNSQGFRAIKRRAKNKPVLFEIQNEFMPSFRKFLKLRQFVLDGNPFEYLFFNGYGKSAKFSVAQKQGKFTGVITGKTFPNLDPNLPILGAKKFRVYKGKWVRNVSGIFVAASMLQHDIETHIEDYHGETEEEQMVQVGNFMSSVHEQISLQRNKYETKTISGSCSNYNVPDSALKDDSITPNCSIPETCFFCSKYRIHPDEEDIRKILSMEYVIREISIHNARSLKHFDKVMGPILDRIDELLTALQEYKNGIDTLIINIRKDVFEQENLTPYWENKIAVLWRQGVIR